MLERASPQYESLELLQRLSQMISIIVEDLPSAALPVAERLAEDDRVECRIQSALLLPVAFELEPVRTMDLRDRLLADPSRLVIQACADSLSTSEGA
jgi:hypothetical protein